VRYVLCILALLAAGICCMAQTNDAGDQYPLQDYAGRAVEPVGSSTPAAVPVAAAPDAQSFEQGVRDVFFDFDRYQLTADDHTTLQQDAEWLKSHPDVVFTIEGDADPRGDIVYNLYLSDARALAARDELVKLGVSEKQVLFAEGWGKLYPVCQQDDESCWSKDRRAHFAPWSPDDVPGMNAAAATTAALTPQ